METRQLGRFVRIAPLVLGGNVFGWTAGKETSFSILDRFADAGFQAIDTADVYCSWVPGHHGGESETIIGEWMARRGNRSRMVIITKVGSDMGDGRKGLSAAYIPRALDASLQRLGTDYVDVYLSHWPDPSVPYEETLGAYQALLAAGKVREIGASNYNAEQLRASLDVSRSRGLPRYEVLQPEYNLYDRESFEGPLRDLTIAEGIGVITYFSLAKGFLTGKYRTADDLTRSPRGGGVKRYLDDRGRRVLQALDDVAAAHDASPASVAIAWIIAQPGVTAPIASATSPQQVDSLLQAATLQLSAREVAQLTEASTEV
jgi:aryl-alcohol dehydrogenase-like predicted oxidoreductase